MAEEDGKPDADGTDDKKPAEKMFSQEQLDKIIGDRLKRSETKIRTELEATLMVDEAFRDKALKTWDVKPETETLDDGKVKELYTAWETKHVDPLKVERDALSEKVGRLTRDQLEADILSAAAGSPIQKALLQRQESGHSALFAMIEGNFVQDGDEWRVRGKGEDDFRPSPDGERLYMDVPEYIKDWAASKLNAVFIDDTIQGGTGSDGDPAEGGKKVYTRAEFKRLCDDVDYYAKHRDELAAADREGRVKR